jgi:TIM21
VVKVRSNVLVSESRPFFNSKSVIRTTARTSNLIVILLGAGLSVALIYALTTDLFSRNSASVLHNEACEKIKSSSEVCIWASFVSSSDPECGFVVYLIGFEVFTWTSVVSQ